MIMRYYLFCLFVLGLFFISFSCKDENEINTVEPVDSLKTETILAMENAEINLWQKYTYKERVGLTLYSKYCAVCHGTTGKGDGFNAYNLDPRPTNLADSSYMAGLSDESLTKIISYGGQSMNKSVLMPAYLNTITSTQINSIIDYLRKLSNTAPK